jgi:hypothetical protein
MPLKVTRFFSQQQPQFSEQANFAILPMDATAIVTRARACFKRQQPVCF